MIPYLYWQTVTTRGATFQTSHSMDLTRVALHYSFLADGRKPYRKVKGATLADAVPDYLTDTEPILDMVRCSRELIHRVTATGDVDVQLRLASAGPDLDALDYTPRLVECTRRYAEVAPYGLGGC